MNIKVGDLVRARVWNTISKQTIVTTVTHIDGADNSVKVEWSHGFESEWWISASVEDYNSLCANRDELPTCWGYIQEKLNNG